MALTKEMLITWIGYWDRVSMGPNLHNVHTAEDMTTCRRYNRVMQAGRMWEVTDLEMWEALLEYRARREKAA